MSPSVVKNTVRCAILGKNGVCGKKNDLSLGTILVVVKIYIVETLIKSARIKAILHTLISHLCQNKREVCSLSLIRN